MSRRTSRAILPHMGRHRAQRSGLQAVFPHVDLALPELIVLAVMALITYAIAVVAAVRLVAGLFGH